MRLVHCAAIAIALCFSDSTAAGGDASLPPDIEMRQIEAQIELQLVVVGRHVRAQLVKRFVVLGFLHVRQFMHHDHLQELGGGIAEHGGDADLAARLEPAALYPGDRGVGAQRVLHHLQLAVVDHLAQRHRFSQMPVLQRLHVVVQLAIVAHRVELAVPVGQYRAQPILFDQRAHLRLQVFRITDEVLQCFHRQWDGGQRGRPV